MVRLLRLKHRGASSTSPLSTMTDIVRAGTTKAAVHADRLSAGEQGNWLSDDDALSSPGSGDGQASSKATDIPEIGDELAAARALRHLADRLLGVAADDIKAIEGHEVHLRPQRRDFEADH